MADFAECVKDNLPDALVDVLKDLSLEKILQFAYELIDGASVEEALIAVGVGTEAAAAAGIAIAAAGLTTAAVVTVVLSGCVVSTTLDTVWSAIKSLFSGPSIFDLFRQRLADAGYAVPEEAAA